MQLQKMDVAIVKYLQAHDKYANCYLMVHQHFDISTNQSWMLAVQVYCQVEQTVT
uniref:Uncharacterized protein n=1 Tax=Arundo donax TaxID=35708 RepID=A0A0A9FM07_ARUDO